MIPGFEKPLSGPGPVLNRARRPDGVGDFNRLVGDYTNPILKPEAAEIVKQHSKQSLAGIGYPTPSNQCWPGGVPYMFWGIEMQVFQGPREITMLYMVDHLVCHVRMNQPHSAQVTRTLLGDSVGNCEGDTLVIDTIGIKPGPYAMIDIFGTPHTGALHVIERYRLLDYETIKAAAESAEKENLRLQNYRNNEGAAVDDAYRGKGPQLEFTDEDAGVSTMRSTALITYRRATNEWHELVCAETATSIITAKASNFRRRTNRISKHWRRS